MRVRNINLFQNSPQDKSSGALGFCWCSVVCRWIAFLHHFPCVIVQVIYLFLPRCFCFLSGKGKMASFFHLKPKLYERPAVKGEDVSTGEVLGF